MASGVQFADEISTGEKVVIYTPGANVGGVTNVNFVNLGASPATIRLGYAASATTVAKVYIEYNFPLGVGEALERTGIVIAGTQSLIAEALSASSVQVTVWSMEDSQ